MFVGTNLVCLDANASRLFDFVTMQLGTNRRVCTVRVEALQQIIGNRQTVMVRIPFNFTPAENQVEALLDELMSMGFKISGMTAPTVGVHCLIYTLERK